VMNTCVRKIVSEHVHEKYFVRALSYGEMRLLKIEYHSAPSG